MDEQIYAVYVNGEETPIGTVRDSTLGAISQMAEASGKKYRIEPINSEQAKRIRNSILNIPLSPNIEKILANHKTSSLS
jgi:hypothetical protein